MKNTIKIIWMVCLFVLITGFGYAQEKTFTIGVEELDYLPYYSSSNGSYTGFAREVLDTFAKQNHIQLNYKPYPVRRLFKMLLDQKIDFKFPDNPHWQSDLKKGKAIVYSDPMVKYIDGVMVLPENKGKGLPALKKLGTVQGFTPWDYLDLIKSGKVQIHENTLFSGLLKQVIVKRIDGAYINPVVASYQLDHVLDKPDALVYDPKLPHTESVYLMSTIKHPDVIKKFNTFLSEQKALIDQLKVKYKVILPE